MTSNPGAIPVPADDTVQGLLLRLGLRLAHDGREKEAREALLNAAHEPGEPGVAVSAWLALAGIELDHGSLSAGGRDLVDAVLADPASPSRALARITEALARPPASQEPDAVARAVATALLQRGRELIASPSFPPDGVMLVIEAALRAGAPDQAVELVRQAIEGRDATVAAGIRERILAGSFHSGTDDHALAALWRARLLDACGAWAEAATAADLAVQLSGDERGADIDAPALELKARVLDKAGDAGQAAAAWLDAALLWMASGRPDTALTALDQAGSRCGDPLVPFYRAECLRMRRPPAGTSSHDQLITALRTWDDGAAVTAPDAWTLLTRAFINESLADGGDDPVPRRWAAVLDCERVMAAKPYESEDAWEQVPDPAALAEAASLYWQLGCRATAVHMARDAWRRAPGDEIVLHTTAWVFAGAGGTPPDGLMHAAGESPNAGLRGNAGVLAINSGDLDAADRYLAGAISSDPGLLAPQASRYLLLVQQQRWAEADAALARALELTADAQPEQVTYYALFRAVAGRPAEVLARQDLLLANAESAEGDSELALGIASALAGDPGASRKWLRQARDRLASVGSDNTRESAEWLRAVAATLVRRDDSSHAKAIAGELAEAASLIEADAARKADGEFDSEVALRELASAWEAAAPGDPARLAASLMRARLLLSLGQPQAAAGLLSDVVVGLPTGTFPEAGQAVSIGFLHAAVKAACHGRPGQVAEYLRRSADAIGDAAGPTAAITAVSGLMRSPLLEEIRQPAALVALSQGISAFSRLPRWTSADRVKVGIIRRQVHRRCYAGAYSAAVSGAPATQPGQEAASLPPFAPLTQPRIAVSADPALFPQMADTPGVKWMLSTGLPDMARRLGSDRAPLPGVQIYPDDDLPEGQYQLSILGEPAGSGAVELGDAGSLAPFEHIVEHLADVLAERRAPLLLRSRYLELLESTAKDAGHGSPGAAEATAALAALRQVLALRADPPGPLALVELAERQHARPADLVTNLAGLLPPAKAGPGARPLDAALEERLKSGLTTAGGKPAVIVTAEEAASLQEGFDTWLARAFGTDFTAPPATCEVPVVLVRSPSLLLAAGALAAGSRRRCAIGLLAADTDTDTDTDTEGTGS